MNTVLYKCSLEEIPLVRSLFPTIKLEKRRVYALRRKGACCDLCGLIPNKVQVESSATDKQEKQPHLHFYNENTRLYLVRGTETIYCTNCKPKAY